MFEWADSKVKSNTHMLIPDTQAKEGVPDDHLRWVGQYIIEKKPDVIVHIGDHWDMPSLSSYDRGTKRIEGRRYEADIKAGNDAFALLNEPMRAYNRSRKASYRYNPRKVFCIGNHEERIARATNESAILDGLMSYNDLDTHEWEVHDFLKPVWIDGIAYAHYFANPMSGRPYSGANIELRLKNIGHTFTMGHQQTLGYAIRFVGGRSHHGLVAGACYLHNEDYKGYQGNAHWRGVVMCHQVHDGSYSPMFVDLSYLCLRYEGMALEDFMRKKYSSMYYEGKLFG